MHRNIVAIGGGNVGSGETLPIDRRFVCLCDKERPKLLFVPTASGDDEDYAVQVRATYGDRLGCDVSVLRLCSGDPSRSELAERAEEADLIYVGGGNTKAMLARWRELSFDQVLHEFVAAGKPVGGLSAGAICWFRVGNSDWPQYEQMPGVLTASLDCLGIVDLVLCPHAKNEPFRLGEFQRMMGSEAGVGLALDDLCAIQIRGDEYRLLGCTPEVGGHLMVRGPESIKVEFIKPCDVFRPLGELHARASG